VNRAYSVRMYRTVPQRDHRYNDNNPRKYRSRFLGEPRRRNWANFAVGDAGGNRHAASVCSSSGQAEFGESEQTVGTLRSKASLWREIYLDFIFRPRQLPSRQYTFQHWVLLATAKSLPSHRTALARNAVWSTYYVPQYGRVTQWSKPAGPSSLSLSSRSPLATQTLAG
jgi:hypothetical protein